MTPYDPEQMRSTSPLPIVSDETVQGWASTPGEIDHNLEVGLEWIEQQQPALMGVLDILTTNRAETDEAKALILIGAAAMVDLLRRQAEVDNNNAQLEN